MKTYANIHVSRYLTIDFMQLTGKLRSPFRMVLSCTFLHCVCCGLVVTQPFLLEDLKPQCVRRKPKNVKARLRRISLSHNFA